MSKGQVPREPAYFPNMKYRAAKRHQRELVRRTRFRIRQWYYDRDGRPIDLTTAAELKSDESYVRIARTKVVDGANLALVFDVSTVWVGFDFRLNEGPPLIFETMVFSDGGAVVADRYSTTAQAQQGHAATVESVCATLTDPITMHAQTSLYRG
ncbi:hypothetical protein [Nocardia sp. NPDC057030]|uniref:hypothetical protein n=1 Tax=unclassified Nocardia TaxID=2637762 RepID=UPI00362DD38B